MYGFYSGIHSHTPQQLTETTAIREPSGGRVTDPICRHISEFMDFPSHLITQCMFMGFCKIGEPRSLPQRPWSLRFSTRECSVLLLFDFLLNHAGGNRRKGGKWRQRINRGRLLHVCVPFMYVLGDDYFMYVFFMQARLGSEQLQAQRSRRQEGFVSV